MPTVRPPRSLFARFALLTGLLLALLGALLTWVAVRSTEQALLAQAQQQRAAISRSPCRRAWHRMPWRAPGRMPCRPCAPARRTRAVLSGAAGWRAAYPGQRRPGWRNSATAGVGRHGAGAGRGRPFSMARRRSGRARRAPASFATASPWSTWMPRGGRRFRPASSSRAAVILLGMALTMTVVFGVTRRLHRVGGMLAALARGERPPKLPARGPAEIADLCRTANEAAREIDERFAALAAREARFYAVAECAYDVEAWFNPQGRLVWINRSIERVTGYYAAGMRACRQSDRDAGVPEGPGLRRRRRASKALAGTSGDNLEVRLQRKDGNLVWVAVSWHGIHDAKGTLPRVACVAGRHSGAQGSGNAPARDRGRAAPGPEPEGVLPRPRQRGTGAPRGLAGRDEGRGLFSDRDRRVLFCNKALYRIWGSRSTPVSPACATRRCWSARRPCAPTTPPIGSTSPQCCGRRKPALRSNSRSPTGACCWTCSTLVPGEAAGEFIGRVWIYEDITDQKRIADRLIQLGGTRSADQSLQPAPLPRGAGAHARGCGTARGATRPAGRRPGRLQADQ